jgi:predicted nucleic acid-binding protein
VTGASDTAVFTADTDVIADFLRAPRDRRDPVLASALRRGRVILHPWVLAELSLGTGLSEKQRWILWRLPRLPVTPDAEAFRVIGRYRPRGIGWVDLNLILSAAAVGVPVLSRDADQLREHARIAGIPLANP